MLDEARVAELVGEFSGEVGEGSSEGGSVELGVETTGEGEWWG